MSEPSDGADDTPAPVEGLHHLADRLERATFTPAFRGFEPTEVQDLLRSVAQALRKLEGVPSTPATTEHDDIAPVRDGHENAEGGAVAMRLRRAERDAAALLHAARAEAERIVAEARREAEGLRGEAAALRDEARAAVLQGVRQANELLARARQEAGRTGPGTAGR